MPRLLQIALLGHPVLREQATPVEEAGSPEVQSLIEDMLATLADVDGVGLAAPQVYAPLRLFVMRSRPGPRYPAAPTIEPFALVNPEITWRSDEIAFGWEGCLSIPDIRARVPRAQTIGVRYRTAGGEVVETEYHDLAARVFQHELDHLDGIVFFDRLQDTRDIVVEREFKRRFA